MNFNQYRKYTQARIGLGHSGPALPTKAWLEFAFHHARAVDAIKIPWDLADTADKLASYGYRSQVLSTQVVNREAYLLRPDLGRKLNDESRQSLRDLGDASNDSILLMVSNGLSSLAVKNHLQNYLEILLGHFKDEGLLIAHNRVLLVENGRVGLIDDVGELAKPCMGLVIIGERPGLSACDSLAVYLTYRPKLGRTDAERNCVSNIRPPFGLGYRESAVKVMFLIKEAMRRKLSGVLLKEEAGLLTR